MNRTAVALRAGHPSASKHGRQRLSTSDADMVPVLAGKGEHFDLKAHDSDRLLKKLATEAARLSFWHVESYMKDIFIGVLPVLGVVVGSVLTHFFARTKDRSSMQ